MLLESLVAESVLNNSLADESGDLGIFCKAGHLVVVDMTDPLLSSKEANGVFQVLVEQYRALPGREGKVLALDEAHKYMKGETSDGLRAALVNTARLMRHDGIRLLVSTQSPLALAPDLLELVSVAFLHRFHLSNLPATWSLKCGEAAGWEQRPIYRDDPSPLDSAPLFKIAAPAHYCRPRSIAHERCSAKAGLWAKQSNISSISRLGFDYIRRNTR